MRLFLSTITTIISLVNVSVSHSKVLVGGFTDSMMCFDTFTGEEDMFVTVGEFPVEASSEDFETLKREC